MSLENERLEYVHDKTYTLIKLLDNISATITNDEYDKVKTYFKDAKELIEQIQAETT